jgi:hypothetical protein
VSESRSLWSILKEDLVKLWEQIPFILGVMGWLFSLVLYAELSTELGVAAEETRKCERRIDLVLEHFEWTTEMCAEALGKCEGN